MIDRLTGEVSLTGVAIGHTVASADRIPDGQASNRNRSANTHSIRDVTRARWIEAELVGLTGEPGNSTAETLAGRDQFVLKSVAVGINRNDTTLSAVGAEADRNGASRSELDVTLVEVETFTPGDDEPVCG